MNRPRPKGHKRWTLVGGEVIENVHSQANCSGTHCVIHNPSDHHMRAWKMHWRNDRKMMERICPGPPMGSPGYGEGHGIGHPDPDDINPDKTHGCCVPPCCLSPEERLQWMNEFERKTDTESDTSN